MSIQRGIIPGNIRKVRSIYLYLIRNHSIMTETKIYYEIRLLLYEANRRTKDLKIDLIHYIDFNIPPLKEINYTRIVIKNLEKFKKLLTNDIIIDYGKLPGYLPLCIRSYIISFIIPTLN